MKKAMFLIKLLYQLLKLSIKDINRKIIHQYFPKKPRVINLNATDICNSGCIMCNIWKRDKEFEFSPAQLSEILKDKLFSEIRHVGITGGEPTLRDDLPQLYEAVINTLPKLQGVSIITNAIEGEHVYNQIIAINEICKQSNISFSVMISLDGIGRTHDLVRGKEGNFASTEKLINRLKSTTTIPVSIGCTITKTNIWKIDELLTYLKENNIYGRFRIAEFINRLYNNANKGTIRNFSDDEIYNLQLFFKKLQLTFETNETYNRTYQSIIDMLKGEPRKIGCPYHDSGVVLNSKGEIAYCAPKSSIIGSTINESGWKLFKANLKIRRKIIENNCSECIHDYHAEITFNEVLHQLKAEYSRIITRKHYGKYIKLLKIRQLTNSKAQSTYTIFIIGWYGTETVGDKAILGGIFDYYKKKHTENCQFIIGSIYPFITERTLRELDIEAKVVSSTDLNLLRYSAQCSETVMGGGPLMDLDELHIPYIAFHCARSFNRTTTIFGCGIGPLKYEYYMNMVKSILLLSSNILLRDKKSIEVAKVWSNRNDIEFYGDPAKRYIEQHKKIQQIKTSQENTLACFLRDWTMEYDSITDAEQFVTKKAKFEAGIAKKINEITTVHNISKVVFYSMHNFTVGNDDRDFNRQFISKYFNDDNRFSYDEKLSTVDSIIDAMKTSKINLCMRFHSVLFADTLKTQYYAIDYTLGGKIYNYLKDNNKLDRLITVEDITRK